MSPDKVYEVEPVTRLEGHGGLRLVLAEDGKTVKDVQFNITSTRFFEKLCEGRFAEHVPRITNRICGICPVPHHLAATKSVEKAWDVEIPPAAYKLRQLFMNAKQYSSHLLHFFALAAPDFLYGPFAPAAKRNVVSVIKDMPDVGAMALKMMDFGQNICAAIGGKAVGPIAGIVGGMRNPLSSDARDGFLAQIPEQLEYVKKTVDLAKKVVTDYWDVIANLAVTETYYCGVAKKVNGELVHEIYDGDLVVVTPDGEKKVYDPQNYLEAIGEHIPSHSYATHTYYKPVGYPAGIYRTNSLAMINACDRMSTPIAEDARKELVKACVGNGGKVIHHTFAYHWARIVETVEAFELCVQYLKDPDILSTDIKTLDVKPKAGRGVGMVDAPRGNLIYDMKTDTDGICRKLNILVATNHNIAGIEKSVKHAAQQIFEQDILSKIKLPDPMLK
ncbi:MAG: Ni/Fe hydrogenase subunit alpha [Promethearchaeia archaeon]|nr:MAG: Ni/Fe hydrogenase subunit alpha [Candidatus Lokiarchaeia archaeon]